MRGSDGGQGIGRYGLVAARVRGGVGRQEEVRGLRLRGSLWLGDLYHSFFEARLLTVSSQVSPLSK